MPKFQNHKPFITGSEEELDAHHERIRPEYIANALMREAVQNARETGNDIIRTLTDALCLPMWMIHKV